MLVVSGARLLALNVTSIDFVGRLTVLGLSRLAQCLMLAWQQDLVKTYTLRTKLFSYPDVSRADTCQVPQKFADVARKILLQQKSAAFRRSMQMQHWIQTQDGACPYCPEQDSAWHSIIERPAFASCMQPF